MIDINYNKPNMQKCIYCGQDTGDISTNICPKCEQVIYENKEEFPNCVRSEFDYD